MKKITKVLLSKGDDKNSIENEAYGLKVKKKKTGVRKYNKDKRQTVLTKEDYSNYYESDWWYTDEHETFHGPIEWQVFRTMYKVGEITDNMKVCGGDMPDMVQIKTQRKLLRALRQGMSQDPTLKDRLKNAKKNWKNV